MPSISIEMELYFILFPVRTPPGFLLICKEIIPPVKQVTMHITQGVHYSYLPNRV